MVGIQHLSHWTACHSGLWKCHVFFETCPILWNCFKLPNCGHHSLTVYLLPSADKHIYKAWPFWKLVSWACCQWRGSDSLCQESFSEALTLGWAGKRSPKLTGEMQTDQVSCPLWQETCSQGWACVASGKGSVSMCVLCCCASPGRYDRCRPWLQAVCSLCTGVISVMYHLLS